MRRKILASGLVSMGLFASALVVGCINSNDSASNSSDATGLRTVGSLSDTAGTPKVVVCHIPPGNPANAHTITVGAPAVRAHLAHGDTLGACKDVAPPDTDVAPPDSF